MPREQRRVFSKEHVVFRAFLRAGPRLAAGGKRSPARRLDMRAPRPRFARPEVINASGERARLVDAHGARSRLHHLFMQPQRGIGRLLSPPQPPHRILEALAPGLAGQDASPAHPTPGAPLDAVAKAPARAEKSRIRRAEQREKGRRVAAGLELACQLERHRSADAFAGDDPRPARPERADLLRVVRGHVLDAAQRLAATVYPGGLQPEERLIVAERL